MQISPFTKLLIAIKLSIVFPHHLKSTGPLGPVITAAAETHAPHYNGVDEIINQSIFAFVKKVNKSKNIYKKDL